MASDACNVLLRANDGTLVPLKRVAAAQTSETLRDWLSCIEDDVEQLLPFAVPFAADTVKHASSRLEGLLQPSARGVIRHMASSELLSVLQLFDVLALADFLAADKLCDTVVHDIGCLLNGLWDVELREALGAKCDLPQAELAKVARESLAVAPTRRRVGGEVDDGLFNSKVEEMALRGVDVKTLVQLKLVNRVWLERARRALRRRSRQVWPQSLAVHAYRTAFTAPKIVAKSSHEGRDARAADVVFHMSNIQSHSLYLEQ